MRKQVDVVVEGMAWELMERLMQGVMRYAREKQGWVMDHRVVSSPAHILGLRPHAIDGMIAYCPSGPMQRKLARVARAECPVVHLLERPKFSEAPWVAVDDRAVGAMAARYLAGKGLRRLAYYGWDAPWSALRAEGFAQAAREHGVEAVVEGVEGVGQTQLTWEQSTSPQRQRAFVQRLPGACGVLCCNDQMARSIRDAALSLGRPVPDDLAIMGVDNSQMFCEFGQVPLTSVDCGFGDVGYRAAALLDKAIAGRGHSGWAVQQVLPPVRVVERQSTNVLLVEDAEVRAALRFIEQHVHTRCTVEDLQRNSTLSRRALEGRFRRALGTTPRRCIEAARMRKAEMLLQTTDLKLGEVARRCGFGYESHFNLLFAKTHGMSPGRYRRSHRPGGLRQG